MGVLKMCERVRPPLGAHDADAALVRRVELHHALLYELRACATPSEGKGEP